MGWSLIPSSPPTTQVKVKASYKLGEALKKVKKIKVKKVKVAKKKVAKKTATKKTAVKKGETSTTFSPVVSLFDCMKAARLVPPLHTPADPIPPLPAAVKKPSTKKPTGVKKVTKKAGAKPKAPKAVKPKTVKKAVKKVGHHGVGETLNYETT